MRHDSLKRIPLLVPSMLVLGLFAVLMYSMDSRASIFAAGGCILLGYLVALFSIGISAAGWFRAVVSISHSMVLAYLLAAGLISAYPAQETSRLFLNAVSFYPFTAFAIAVTIWLLGRCVLPISTQKIGTNQGAVQTDR